VAADRHELIVLQCGHPLAALVSSCTRSAASRHTTALFTQSETLGFRHMVLKLLLISRPSEGKRLCRDEHTKLVQGCSQMTGGEISTAT